MVNPVGLRFCPTDQELVDHYLRLKNLGDNSSHIGDVMNTLNIYSFDPWDLPFRSRIISEDKVWHFFSCKENKYKRGERQSRTTKSGFWKVTGKPMNIMRKSSGKSPREKIGEKRVLVFQSNKNRGGSNSEWVMHEYHSVSSSPNQKMTYTICRVEFKGEASDISSSASEINHNHSLTTTFMNNSEGLTSAYKALLFDLIQELEKSSPLSGFLDVQQPEDVIHEVLNNLSSYSWGSVLDICNNSKL